MPSGVGSPLGKSARKRLRIVVAALPDSCWKTIARISALKCDPPVRSPGRYGPTASITRAMTGSTRRRCARAFLATVARSTARLVTREDARGAVAREGDHVIAVHTSAHLHPGRPGRHARHGEPHHFRLFAQHALDVVRRYVALDHVSVHERGVARMQVVRDAAR